MKYLVLSALLFLGACSSSPLTNNVKVKTFIDQWKADYEPSEAYAAKYQQYLESVETLYINEGKFHFFDPYLSSIDNMNQLMGHAEHNMPYKFKKERGRHANPNLKEYKDYLASNLSYTKRRLGNERKARMVRDLGPEFYQKLQANHEAFSKKNPKFDFPL